MGVTVFYRGRIKEGVTIETFERDAINQVTRLGGTYEFLPPDDDGQPDEIRGILASLHSHCDPVSLLVSPEGWLVSVSDLITDGSFPIEEASWSFVKTQYAPIETHVQVIELLDWLAANYVPDLEVIDEGHFWEKRDIESLGGQRALIERAMDALEGAFGKLEVTEEERLDTEKLAERLEEAANKANDEIKQSLH